MPPTAILALDLGATTGWALMSPHGLTSGVWKVGVGITDVGIRCNALKMRLKTTSAIFGGFQAIYFEEIVFVKSTYAILAYGGYRAVVEMFAMDKFVDTIGIKPREIKKHATGKGNAPKDLVEDMVRSWKVVDHVIDDNHADALALLDLALTRDYNGSILDYQQQVKEK